MVVGCAELSLVNWLSRPIDRLLQVYHVGEASASMSFLYLELICTYDWNY